MGRVCRFNVDVACNIVPRSMTLLSLGKSCVDRSSDHSPCPNKKTDRDAHCIVPVSPFAPPRRGDQIAGAGSSLPIGDVQILYDAKKMASTASLYCACI